MDRNKVILLVEDNQDDEELTVRALRKNQILDDVVVARDGEEALDFLFGTGDHAGRDVNALPDLVVLDLNLPKLNGLEVLRRVRADPRTKLVPVVVLSSSKEDEDIVRSYSVGANAYVQKPVDFKEFDVAVRAVGAFWLSVNQSPAGRSPAS